MKKINLIIILSVAVLLVYSCQKDPHTPPKMSVRFLNGTDVQDTTLKKDSSITVNVKATKTEDELRTINVSDVKNGGASATFQNVTLSSAQYTDYQGNFTLPTGASGDKTQWLFTVTDKDGNITTKSFTITAK
jgi:hypothetical protein